MKTLKLFAAMTALCTGLQAQNTGINTYQHLTSGPQLILTDGARTSVNSKGYILSGVNQNATGSSLFIDKTDVDGLIAGGTEFSREYRFASDNIKPCGTSYAGGQFCAGMTLVEYQFGGAEWYMMAAAFQSGCLYSSLDFNGNILRPAYYPFPQGAKNPTKPLIKASAFNPNQFYIVGNYELNGIPHMYVMGIDIVGNTPNPFSLDYIVAAGAKKFKANALLESPFSTSPSGRDLVIVGNVDDGSGVGEEGFFLTIDATTGIGFTMLTYGVAGTFSNEHFNAINVAKSGASGASGFIIGGSSDYDLSLGKSWMLKIDPNGGIQWTSIIPPSYGTRGEVTGVLERFSNANNAFEYYGCATENKGSTIFKLDEFGNMFTGISGFNEFIYNDNFGQPSQPVAISDDNNPGNATEGVQVYSTNAPVMGDYFMARACFNGAAGNTGCSFSNITLNVIPNVYGGPKDVSKRDLKINKGLKNCTNFLFGSGITPVNIDSPCNNVGLPTAPYGGDQSKSAGVTGIKSVSNSDKFSVSPNPVSDKLSIAYTSSNGSDVTISLFNNLGQLVTPAITAKGLQNTAELDLSRLNLNSGVYFVTVTMDGVNTTKKIIYTK